MSTSGDPRPRPRAAGLRVPRRWRRPLLAGALIAVSLVLDPGQLTGATAGPLAAGLMLAATLVAGLPILRNAVAALRVKTLGIDLLVAIAAIGASLLGNFWEAAAVTFLFSLGHALEDATLAKTRSALADLVSTAPETAVVLEADGSQRTVPAHAVTPGATVLVKAGARVPVDGVVLTGSGAVDEASITGESIPAEKADGDEVFAGTVATAGLLHVEARGIGADTTLARIIHRVEAAQEARARTQQFMDRFSRWYTPAIMVLAVVTGLLTRDVPLALTLLVIGCPGALVISIPVAIVAGIGRGAKDGVLVKGGEYLERSARVDAVAVDKTGTLTAGTPRLTDVVALEPGSEDEVLAWAARLEAASDHPLAAPIVAAGRERGLLDGGLATDVDVVIGRGLTGQVDGRAVAVGNLALLRERGTDPRSTDRVEQIAADLAGQGRTPMAVAVDDVPLGVLAVADTVRPEAEEMIRALHRIGVREVIMLTGDQAGVAHAVAREVGVDQVRAGLLPEDKLDAIVEMQRRGRTVAMVGDGINDAPALATADIGVAMGAAGSAVAIETADIALMGDRLERLPQALGLARRTVAVMRQNIIISLVTVLALLAGVFAGGVTMSIGMLVHELSVLAVIVNAMRLLGGSGRSRR
ncbi:cation-translocating P-type ATPase [Micrococcus sp.]|uniref:heavy metal translocating P-type ATPase n=1 Tax=Micrococcus sp. TaxID=1271 RepID=UPI002A915DE4|nr:cation-translocating P-type ATPase [Micrococcus sp.]MDY6054385.1 cation-translocating P-type ATPase [Micrococcus sp.]